MKKGIILLLMLLSTFVYSANVDSAESRAKALKEMQAWFDRKEPYVWGVTDCSHYVAAGMSASGLKIPTGSAANGRYTQSMWNSQTAKIAPGQESSLKAGDLVFFNRSGANGIGHVGMVFENPSAQCGGGPLIIDTYSEKKPPRKKCLSEHNGYVGAISHDEIIRANGHTPVNTDGTVIVPSGSSSYGQNYTPATLIEQQYTVDLDIIMKQYIDQIKAGLDKLGIMLIPLLSALFLLDLTFYLFKEGIKNIFHELMIRFIKFAFFLFVLENAVVMIEIIYETFMGIADYLGGNTGIKVMDFFDTMSMYIMTLFESFTKIKLTSVLLDINSVIATCIMVLIFIVMIAYSFFKLMFELFINSIFFFLAMAMSICLFPLKISKLTDQFGSNPVNVAVVCGMKIIITFILMGIAVQLLGTDSGMLNEIDVNNLDLVEIYTVTIYLTIICMLVKKINSFLH